MPVTRTGTFTPPTTLPITGAADAHRRAVRLGFRFVLSAAGDGNRIVLGPAAVPPDRVAEVEAIRDFIASHEPAVLAVADGGSGLARQIAPPRKVGYGLDGKPLPTPAPAEPEEPPYVAPPTRGLPPVSSLSPAQVAQECSSISAEYHLLSDRIAALPEEAEGEDREVQSERERLWARVGFLQRRAQALEDRRRAEMWDRIEQAERERRLAADGGPRLLVPGWQLPTGASA